MESIACYFSGELSEPVVSRVLGQAPQVGEWVGTSFSFSYSADQDLKYIQNLQKKLIQIAGPKNIQHNLIAFDGQVPT